MAYVLEVPDEWRSQGWKVKIRDDELSKSPHVTILRKVKAWRMCLRTGRFLDIVADPAEVPRELVEFVWLHRAALRGAWVSMYPEEPV